MVFLLRMHLKQYGLTARLPIKYYQRNGGRGFQTYCFVSIGFVGMWGGGGGVTHCMVYFVFAFTRICWLEMRKMSVQILRVRSLKEMNTSRIISVLRMVFLSLVVGPFLSFACFPVL